MQLFHLKKNHFFFLKEIEFVDGSLLKLKSYIEVYLEQPVEFKLLLVEMDSEEIVWKAKLRECKCFGLWGSGDGKANRVMACPVIITFKNLMKRNKGPGSQNRSASPGSQLPCPDPWRSVGGSGSVWRLPTVGGSGQQNCFFPLPF